MLRPRQSFFGCVEHQSELREKVQSSVRRIQVEDHLNVTSADRQHGDHSQGRPGLGLLAAAGAFPVAGRAVKPVARAIRGIFQGLEEMKDTGLRVFARTGSEFAVPSRRVVVVTRNTVPGEGPFRASILEETRSGIRARGHVDGPSEKELIEVIEGKTRTGELAERAERAGIVGLPEIPVGPEARMEFIAERNAERGLMDLARQNIASGKSPTGIMRKLAEGRELPGGVGGFFNP